MHWLGPLVRITHLQDGPIRFSIAFGGSNMRREAKSSSTTSRRICYPTTVPLTYRGDS